MKKTLPLLGIALLTISSLFAQRGAGSLPGTVTDSAGKPLAGVSVFLNNTSIGTTTRTNGSFVLERIPRGKYQLVVSAIGYAAFVTELNGSQLPPELNISLHQKATELEAVTVEPYMENGWERWGKYFLDNFIGTGSNAGSCTIKNKNALRFHFYNKSNRLTVTATEPLIIENFALGYTLEYRLQEFYSDFNSHIVFYLGYPFFREMATTRDSRHKKWEENRRQAYAGSMMHFMRSLYAGDLTEEGFLTTLQVKTRTSPVSADSLLTTHPDETKSLFFNGKLNVSFVNSRKRIPRRSSIELITPVMIIVEENGNYYPPQDILSSGYWGQSEKIGNLLPIDYGAGPH